MAKRAVVATSKVERIPVDKLNAAPYNPRVTLKPSDPEYQKLKASLETFGYVEPIVWNKQTGHVVGGHQRLNILLADKPITAVDAVVVDLPLAKEKILNVALNKIEGRWDEQLLGDLLRELKVSDEVDVSLTGFETGEIDELIASALATASGNGEVAEDEVPALLPEPVGKLGDLWTLGRHRVLCGDAQENKGLSKLARDTKIDACITDPPYGIRSNTDYTRFSAPVTTRFSGTNKNYQPVRGDDKPFNPSIWLEYPSVVLWGANYFADKLPVGTWLVWDKRFANGKAWLSDAELAWMKTGQGVYIFSLTSQGMIRPEAVQHPTQKAVALMAWCIEKAKAGPVVLDPYLGSGTTLIAAEQLGRTCYGVEIEPRYVDVTIRRWQDMTGESAVRESDGAKWTDLG